MWGLALADVALVAWYIGVLVLLEGLLSADNALVLAVMVRHLPRSQQRRVLNYGIWGSIGFRIIALSLSSVLLRLWYCKVIGGGYLLCLAVSHFLRRKDSDHNQQSRSIRMLRGFWGTVASITLADIVFSIDSILAAVATAESFPGRFGENGKLFIVIVGGVLGIITMRFVVRYFLILLERFPGLDEGAYYLVAWIGLKLLISGLHSAPEPYRLPFHIPEWLFWGGMLLIAVVSLVVGPREKSTGDTEVSESLELFDSNGEEVADEAGQDSPDGKGEPVDSQKLGPAQ